MIVVIVLLVLVARLCSVIIRFGYGLDLHVAMGIL